MTDANNTTPQATTQDQNGQPLQQQDGTQQPNEVSSLSEMFWNDTSTQKQQQVAEVIENEQKQEDEEEVMDLKEWIKKEFDIDDVDKFKKSYQELKEKSEKNKSEDIKFENDQSRLIYEYLKENKYSDIKNYLDKQERIDLATKGDITKNNVDLILKTNMQLKFPDLSEEEIDFKLKKQYNVPKKPIQQQDELDEDYEERVSQWEEVNNDVQMAKMIDAKMARPELENSKTKITLPEITQRPTVPHLSKEEIEKMDSIKKAFVDEAENELKNFNTISETVKNKDVNYSVDYKLSKEEKESLSSMVKLFSENNLDMNALFAQRWVNDDYTINTKQMIKDLSNVLYADVVRNKIANDSANQRIEQYIKDKKKIDINNGFSGGVTVGKQNNASELADAFWGVSR